MTMTFIFVLALKYLGYSCQMGNIRRITLTISNSHLKCMLLVVCDLVPVLVISSTSCSLLLLFFYCLPDHSLIPEKMLPNFGQFLIHTNFSQKIEILIINPLFLNLARKTPIHLVYEICRTPGWSPLNHTFSMNKLFHRHIFFFSKWGKITKNKKIIRKWKSVTLPVLIKCCETRVHGKQYRVIYCFWWIHCDLMVAAYLQK